MGSIPFLVGVGLVAVVLLVVFAANGFRDPLRLIRGVDNRLSTSQFQFWLWTLVVFFAYTTIWTARALKGVPDPVSDIPANVLLVMGFSAGTFAGAKAITGALVDSGRIPKTDAPLPARGSFGGIAQLLTGDGGGVDLQKVQILTWTTITVGIYILLTTGTVSHIQQLAGSGPLRDEIQTKGYLVGLPNIDGALMVLMGLSQAAYLGGKLTSASQPRITALTTSTLALGQAFSVLGASLGSDTDAGRITLDGVDVPVTKRAWTPTRIDAQMPDQWAAMPAGSGIMLRVVNAGQVSEPWPVQVAAAAHAAKVADAIAPSEPVPAHAAGG